MKARADEGKRDSAAIEAPLPRHMVPISPWHDISLRNADGTLNFVCEIPKWSRAKYEIAVGACTCPLPPPARPVPSRRPPVRPALTPHAGEDWNPIKQDTRNGALRDYEWGDMLVNYGAFPQTWEDPSHVSEGTGCVGDNDPLDVMEIGVKRWSTGAVVAVKVLGVIALIDGGCVYPTLSAARGGLAW